MAFIIFRGWLRWLLGDHVREVVLYGQNHEEHGNEGTSIPSRGHVATEDSVAGLRLLEISKKAQEHRQYPLAPEEENSCQGELAFGPPGRVMPFQPTAVLSLWGIIARSSLRQESLMALS